MAPLHAILFRIYNKLLVIFLEIDKDVRVFLMRRKKNILSILSVEHGDGNLNIYKINPSKKI